MALLPSEAIPARKFGLDTGILILRNPGTLTVETDFDRDFAPGLPEVPVWAFHLDWNLATFQQS